jgi:hypothetical protein
MVTCCCHFPTHSQKETDSALVRPVVRRPVRRDNFRNMGYGGFDDGTPSTRGVVFRFCMLGDGRPRAGAVRLRAGGGRRRPNRPRNLTDGGATATDVRGVACGTGANAVGVFSTAVGDGAGFGVDPNNQNNFHNTFLGGA